MDTYDLLVIGSGPAGQRAAISAEEGKTRCAGGNAQLVGGVCVNTGTIPSKTMREAVLHLSGYNYRSIYGMNYRVKEKITMADLAFRVQHVIKTEIDVTEAQLSRNGIDVLHGVASFVDPTHVRVDHARWTPRYEAENIIIATGTKPASVAQGSHQRQAPSSTAIRFSSCPSCRKIADRGRRRRHRRRIHLHVRRARRARDTDGESGPSCWSLPTRKSWKRSATTCATAA